MTRVTVMTGRLNQVGIAALSETRFSEQGQLEVGAGSTFFWSGRPKSERRDADVAFAIRNDIVGRLPCVPLNTEAEMVRQDPRHISPGADRNRQHPCHAEASATTMERPPDPTTTTSPTTDSKFIDAPPPMITETTLPPPLPALITATNTTCPTPTTSVATSNYLLPPPPPPPPPPVSTMWTRC
ncbi:unnamed protein product [Schistocephalus solidus]|uniref:Uncharacterized protein n=1 Tax=Schistocephalus solidus TaxID=70667 RepID=A0A183TB99_SCHSO|nr:unnamed protein product [Schistocephalus solidus]